MPGERLPIDDVPKRRARPRVKVEDHSATVIMMWSAVMDKPVKDHPRDAPLPGSDLGMFGPSDHIHALYGAAHWIRRQSSRLIERMCSSSAAPGTQRSRAMSRQVMMANPLATFRSKAGSR